MELQFLSFPVLAFLFFVFIIAQKVLQRSKAKNLTSKLPPGPRKLPLIGNLHQLAGSLLHHSLTDLARKHGPFMHLQLGQIPAMIVSSPEIAKEVMKTHDIVFAERPTPLASKIMSYDFKNILSTPYGDYWRQIRKLCMVQLLNAKRVQSFRSIREEEVSSLIRTVSLSAKPSVNLSEKIYSSTYTITSKIIFGRKFKDQEEFISVNKQVSKLGSGLTVADMFPSVKLLAVINRTTAKLKKLHQEADRILENIVNEHRERVPRTGNREAEEDLVDALLKIEEHGDLEFPFTADNIKAVIFDIYSAGSEAPSVTVEWAMSEMLKNPRVMEKAQAEVRKVFDEKQSVDETSLHELKYLKSVIKETMRLHPPVPLIPRQCRERCEINGYEMPVKIGGVVVNFYAIGRDPEYWSDADRFYPERFTDSSIDYKGKDFEYIPFGSGRRICPGISFSMVNIELPLAQLLYHFNWKIPDGVKEEDLDMTEAFGLTVRRKNDLYLIPIPYHASIAS